MQIRRGRGIERLSREYELGLDEAIEERTNRLIKLLTASHPAMIICYGNGLQKAREFEEFFGIESTVLRKRHCEGY